MSNFTSALLSRPVGVLCYRLVVGSSSVFMPLATIHHWRDFTWCVSIYPPLPENIPNTLLFSMAPWNAIGSLFFPVFYFKWSYPPEGKFTWSCRITRPIDWHVYFCVHLGHIQWHCSLILLGRSWLSSMLTSNPLPCKVIAPAILLCHFTDQYNYLFCHGWHQGP